MRSSPPLRVLVALTAALLLPLVAAPAPTAATVVSRLTAIAPGGGETCGVTVESSVKCWGYGRFGGLGTGTRDTSLIPVDVSGLADGVASVESRYERSCAITMDGDIGCWGLKATLERGPPRTPPPYSLTPVAISGLGPVAALALGGVHSCALTVAGGLRCWGENGSGQLGDGSTAYTPHPVDVVGLKAGVAAVTAGSQFTCALTTVGGVKCWGANNVGQLGNGSTASTGVPSDVVGLGSGVAEISAGWDHACARTTGGQVLCWGYNGSGKIGNGVTVGVTRVPSLVRSLSGIRAISAGGAHTCVLTTGHAVMCWGYNRWGQLGNGTASNGLSPTVVRGLSGGVLSVASGSEHTCAILPGTVKCWGNNIYGQLGNGTRANSKVPVAVDLTVHQSIALQASSQPGTIEAGSSITFTATATPSPASGERPTIRFEVYRREADTWQLASRRDLVADAVGRVTVRWTFVTTGARFVRARALSTASYTASSWSPRLQYLVQ